MARREVLEVGSLEDRLGLGWEALLCEARRAVLLVPLNGVNLRTDAKKQAKTTQRRWVRTPLEPSIGSRRARSLNPHPRRKHELAVRTKVRKRSTLGRAFKV